MATRRTVVRRAAGYAVVVGAALIAINHGPALIAGDLDRRRLLQMGLTVCVPYVVSTLSSVGAIMGHSSFSTTDTTNPDADRKR